MERFIREHAVSGAECDYCDVSEASEVCASLEEFAGFASHYITDEYMNAEEEDIDIEEAEEVFGEEETLPLRMVAEDVFSREGQEIRHAEVIRAIAETIDDVDNIWIRKDLIDEMEGE